MYFFWYDTMFITDKDHTTVVNDWMKGKYKLNLKICLTSMTNISSVEQVCVSHSLQAFESERKPYNAVQCPQP